MRLRDQLCVQDRLMTWDDSFSFRCHPGIDCFNSCCKDVTIFLNPLDVIRLRSALGISSTEFIENYTHRVLSKAGGMPAVVLKMNLDEAKTCPFVGDVGCQVYEDRPYSCRLYPLDTEQGVEFRFIVDQEACHGLREPDEWTVEKWRREQGLLPYDDPDHNLKDVMLADQLWESKIEDPRMQDMIPTASENLYSAAVSCKSSELMKILLKKSGKMTLLFSILGPSGSGLLYSARKAS